MSDKTEEGKKMVDINREEEDGEEDLLHVHTASFTALSEQR